MPQDSDTMRVIGSFAQPQLLSGYEQFSMVSEQLFPMPRPTEMRNREEAVDPFEIVGEE